MQKGLCIAVCVLCFFMCNVTGNQRTKGTIFIEGRRPIAKTDENYICATIDLWPSSKCDNGSCSWGRSSILNLDLKNVVLINAIKAFSPLKIRMGGTLQDRLIYQTEGSSEACNPFVQNASLLFGYTEGCLRLARWDELNSFLNQSGAHYIFGLNALNGKAIQQNNTASGSWNSTNAASLIHYTVKKGYKVHGWELGNELGGRPIGVGVAPDPYAKDTIALRRLVQDIYKGVDFKPLIMAPGGIFESSWFKQYINKSAGSLDVITHHLYNVGGGSDENLVNRILNVSVLDSGVGTFKNLSNILKNSRTSTVAWISESGGVYNSGRDGVSNAFVFSFWYLDVLGIAATYNTKTYCRQTLVGGNYGLLNTTTFLPNPDYYSALLWHRLMGRYVLSTRFRGTKNIRAYAHCAKQSQGITVLIINLDDNTTVKAKLDFIGKYRWNVNPLLDDKTLHRTAREEYHLTPMDGNIQSRTVLLNGRALGVNSNGAISLEPVVRVNSSEPITVHPHSIVFVHMPNVVIPACK